MERLAIEYATTNRLFNSISKETKRIFIDGFQAATKIAESDVPVHKKPEQQNPRELWLAGHNHADTCSEIHVYTARPLWADDPIHVTTIPKGYKLVSENDLLLAMENLSPSVFDDVGNALFKMFIKELGLSND